MHGLEHILITVDHHLRRTSAGYAITRNHTDQAVIRVGIDKYLDIEHIAQLGIIKHQLLAASSELPAIIL